MRRWSRCCSGSTTSSSFPPPTSRCWAGRPSPGPARPLAAAQDRFVRSLRWQGLSRYATLGDARPVVDDLREWFCVLNAKAGPDFEERLAALERLSAFPERTRRFLASA